MRRTALLGNEDAGAALGELRTLAVNYDPAEVREPRWNFDKHVSHLGEEAPGPPEPGGIWERAAQGVRDYEFTPPELIRAVYDVTEPLLGRNILLEGRFYGLRFHLGVRITEVVDVSTATERRSGWAYETLEHHLERGKVLYEVVKDYESGRVQFLATVYSEGSPAMPPILKFGWAVFGRRTQLQFYKRIGEQLRAIATSAQPAPPQRRRGNLVLVPAGAKPSLFDKLAAIRSRHPADR
ncbi:MAG: DUF1990 family protein [Sporichthyaceae bacterium]